jgi:glutathione S-transferase
MRLYYHPASNASHLVRATAALLDLPLELRPVDLFRGENQAPEYLAVNPNGLVPTLDDDGFVLWESGAIAQYLASRRKDPELLPAEPRARAEVARWQCWALAHWIPTTRVLVYECFFKQLKGGGPPDLVAVEQARRDLAAHSAVLDRALHDRRFLLGQALTLADLSVAVGLSYERYAPLPLDDREHLRRWFGELSALPAWRNTAPALG